MSKASTAVTPQAKGSADYLAFLDAGGRELLRWPLRIGFGLVAITKQAGRERRDEKKALLSVNAPFPDATARMELTVANKAIWRAEVPERSPEVHLITPKGGEHVGASDTLRVEWQASHPQGLTLDYTLEVSHDAVRPSVPWLWP